MSYPESFAVSTPSDREILITRNFAAPRQLVFDGWTMPVCEIDLRVGGGYRYLWRKESTAMEMGMGGVFQAIDAPRRLVATEKFDQAWYAGEAIDTTLFLEVTEGTRIELTVLYESQEARDTAKRSGMEHGMAAGYSRLETILSSIHNQEPR